MTDPQDAPLVSVIMNAHNSEEFLAEALESVIAQSYTNWEVILWDNASTDGSRAIAESFGDSRIRYFEIPDKVSLYESRMNAVGQAQGEFVAFLDCDDMWLPNKIERQMSVFSTGACVMTCTDFVIQDENRNWPNRRSVRSVNPTYDFQVSHAYDFLTDNRVGFSSFMVRRKAAGIAWPASPPAYSMIEDFDMIARLFRQGTLMPINEPLMIYRLHSRNFSWRSEVSLQELEDWAETHVDLGLSNTQEAHVQALLNEKVLLLRCRLHLVEGRKSEAARLLLKAKHPLSKTKYLLALIVPTSLFRRLVHAN